jgi:serine/threonine-protein kinase
VLDLLQLEMQPEAKSVVNASTHNSEAFDLYLKGEGNLRRLDGHPRIDAAVSLLEKAVQTDPSFALARAALAEAYYDRFDGTKDPQWLARADAESSRARELNNSLPQVHATSGLIMRGTGRYDQAAAEFREAIRLDSADYESQRLLAKTLEDQGHADEAERVYLDAIRSKPSYWPTDRSLGIFYLNRGEYDKAKPWLKLVTELAPQNATGFLNLGILYFLTGRHSEAESALRTSISLQPMATAYTDLGTIQFFERRFSESVESFEKAVHLSQNNSDYWGNLADAYRQIPSRRQDSDIAYHKAIELASQQLDINPNDAVLRGSLALYLAKTGATRKSVTEISKALSFGSKNFNVPMYAAQVYQISGDHALALRHLKDALTEGYPVDQVRLLPEFSGAAATPQVQQLLSEYDPQTKK